MTATPRRMQLRERNRLTTRDAIAEAAMQLSMRHGIQAVRIEDIAAEAGIALRTFRHYFANKYEALVARHLAWMHMAAEALRDRPADEPLWTAIPAAFISHWESGLVENDTPTPALLAELRLLFGDRNLQGEILKAGVADDGEFALVVAERTGSDASSLYPRLVAGAVTVVMLLALDAFLKADPPVPIKALMRDAFDQLARGFPEPGSRRPS